MGKNIEPKEQAELIAQDIENYLGFMPDEIRRYSSIEIAQIFTRYILDILQDERIPSTIDVNIIFNYWNNVDDILADMEEEEYKNSDSSSE